MMKQYMKNKSRLGFFLAMCLGLFSCSKFLEENPKDKLPEDDVYNTISEVYLNAVCTSAPTDIHVYHPRLKWSSLLNC